MEIPSPPRIWLWVLAVGAFVAGAAAQDRVAPRPLYRDPVFDAPTDPVICYAAERGKWFMWYTQRRATAPNTPGVTWIHGTKIGLAESADRGVHWKYRGTVDIPYGRRRSDDTFWAPEVIWNDGTYHMYVVYFAGIFNDWHHPRAIVHLTSPDALHWTAVGPVDLKSEAVIDPCVMQLPNGTWRMWYKDERKHRDLWYADSPDLYHWTPVGNAVTDFNGEGPKVFDWKGRYWLIADCWANGMRVWSSTDATHWTGQKATLVGSHGDVVVHGDRAWWFYFGAGHRAPGGHEDAAAKDVRTHRTTAINVLELSVHEGQLAVQDPAEPTTIDLGSEREAER